MSLCRQQFLIKIFCVILLHRTHRCHLQEFVTVIHLNAERFKGTHHFIHIGNDWFVFTLELGKEVLFEYSVKTQFHHFGIDHHKFEICRMHLEKQ